jgi:hypothetical protein
MGNRIDTKTMERRVGPVGTSERNTAQERRVHELLSRDTDTELRTEYTRGMDGMPSNNAHFFSKTLLQLLKSDLQSKRLWVANVKTARAHYSSR